MAVLSVALLFLTQLIILHMYLLARGITTYEFLMERKHAERQREIELYESRKSNADNFPIS